MSERSSKQQVASASSWIRLSIAAAVITIVLKSIAAYLSKSVGLLSDAMESIVNLIAAVVTSFALKWLEAPPDDGHPFGHSKGELLAALLEGILVIIAGAAILLTALERLFHPQPIAQLSISIVLSLAATVVNGVVGYTLVSVGKRLKSSALEADGHHLLTDVWTSVAVLVGVSLVLVTGQKWLDPAAAALVALLVIRTGYQILKTAIGGLVDTRLGDTEAHAIERAVEPFRTAGAEFFAIKTRQAGRHVYVHLTVRVPADWTVKEGHDFIDRVERAVAAELHDATVDTHMEPLPEKSTVGPPMDQVHS